MTISIGAHGAAGSDNGNTSSVTLNTQATLNALAGVLCGGGAPAPPTIADANGNTYTQIGTGMLSSGSGGAGYTLRAAVYACLGGVGGAGLTFTATRSGQYPSIFVREYPADNSLEIDTFAQVEDTTTPYGSGAITPSGDGAALFGFMADNRNSGGSPSVAAPFSDIDSLTNLSAYYLGAAAGAIQGTAAPVEASFTIGGGATAFSGLMWTVALRETAGGGGEITGAVDATLEAAGVDGAGTVAIAGAVAQTLADATLDAGTSDDIDGAVEAALDPATVEAAGTVGISGAAAVELDDATVAASDNVAPSLGAYTTTAHATGAGTDPLVAEVGTTQAGSTLVAATLNHVYDADLPPTDNNGSTFELVERLNYTLWPNSGLAIWKATNIAGREGHEVYVQTDTTPTDEITVFVAEIRNPGELHGDIIEVLAPNDLVSAPVTTSAPALMLAFWGGDYADTGTLFDANPRDGFVVLGEQMGPGSVIQGAMAYKIEPSPGTYSVGWDESPEQGALLGLIAIEGTAVAGISGTLVQTLADAALDAAGTVAVSGAQDATLDAATVAAAGTVAIAGDADADLQPVTADALGEVAITGAGAATLDAATLDADATVGGGGGVVDVDLAPATVEGQGAVAIAGAAEADLQPATADAQGTVAITGASAATLDDASLQSHAAVGTPTGAVDADLDAATLQAEGAVGISGAAAAVLDDVGLVAGDAVPVDTMPSLTIWIPQIVTHVRIPAHITHIVIPPEATRV